MKKEEQIMNGAEAPETGSKPKEKDNVDQFPGQKMSPKHKSEHRLLNFKEFVADKFEKFNKNTIEKEAMDGCKTGEDCHDTMDNKDKTEHKSMK